MLDRIEQKIVDDVGAFGYHIIQVNADKEGPGFAYSVGFMQTFGHPEIILFGLRNEVMVAVLRIIAQMIKAGRRFEEPGLYEGFLEGFACKLVPVLTEHHRDYLGCAMWHCRYVGKIGSLQAVQLLWPDKAGLFPHEAGCDPRAIKFQPMLNEP